MRSQFIDGFVTIFIGAQIHSGINTTKENPKILGYFGQRPTNLDLARGYANSPTTLINSTGRGGRSAGVTENLLNSNFLDSQLVPLTHPPLKENALQGTKPCRALFHS